MANFRITLDRCSTQCPCGCGGADDIWREGALFTEDQDWPPLLKVEDFREGDEEDLADLLMTRASELLGVEVNRSNTTIED